MVSRWVMGGIASRLKRADEVRQSCYQCLGMHQMRAARYARARNAFLAGDEIASDVFGKRIVEQWMLTGEGERHFYLLGSPQLRGREAHPRH